MRESFREYYQPSQKEFDELWQECTFAFDANVLLDTYRYTPETRETLLEVLEQLKDRIWLPYQAAYEYQENRLAVIFEHTTLYDKLKKKLEKIDGELNDLKSSRRHPYIDQLLESVSPLLRAAISNLENVQSQHPNFLKDDVVRDRLTDLFDHQVGAPFPKEELDKIYTIAGQRYENKKPPGYKDAQHKPAPQQYGDLILWFQLLAYAQEHNSPIILVTSETKEDWWLRVKGRTIGPRPELLREMYDEAGVRFYMYSVDQFTIYARDFLKLQAREEAAEEMRQVRYLASSNIRSISYDADTETLDVEFQSGGVYRYSGVPKSVYTGLINATSPGRFFFNRIKGDYSYKKVTRTEPTVEEIVNWFFEHYEDPVHGVPYESAEGGYQYYAGGPYDAREEIEDRFPHVPANTIDEALEIISDYGYEWVERGQY